MMNIVKKVVTASLLLASTSVAAEVTLQLHRDFEAILVNGESTGFSLMGRSEYVLPDGHNQIVVRMSKLIPRGSEHEKFTTKPMVLTFNATDSTINVLPSREIRSMNDIDDFNINPSVVIEGVTPEDINFHQGILLRSPGLIPDYNRDLIAYNNTHNFEQQTQLVAYVPVSTSVPEVAPAAPVVTPAVADVVYQAEDGSSANLSPQELQGVFLQMSIAEKQAFMAWAVQNMN